MTDVARPHVRDSSGNIVEIGRRTSDVRMPVTIENGTAEVGINSTLGALKVDAVGLGGYSLSDVARTYNDVPSASTGREIVAAVTAKKITVLALVAVCGGTATTLKFLDGSTQISPTFALAANGGMVLPLNNIGWLQTSSGAALNATSGTGSTVAILIDYVAVS